MCKVSSNIWFGSRADTGKGQMDILTACKGTLERRMDDLEEAMEG